MNSGTIWLLLLLLLDPFDGAILTWELPVWGTPECPTPAYLYLHEAYLGPGTGAPTYYDGVRFLGLTDTMAHVGTDKPEIGCALQWGGGFTDGTNDQHDWIPVALDAQFQPLPAACQPFNLQVDGMTWEGI